VKTQSADYSPPRNKITQGDLLEIFRYLFSPTFLKSLFYKLGYHIHDHVAPVAKMHISGNPRIHPTASIRCGESISLGKNSHINAFCCVWASPNSRIILGENLLMGPGCKLFSSNHSTENINIPMNVQPYVQKDIIVGNDVWLGANSVILAGTTIGDGTIVAAGAVVTKDLPPYVIAAGIPARPIKARK